MVNVVPGPPSAETASIALVGCEPPPVPPPPPPKLEGDACLRAPLPP